MDIGIVKELNTLKIPFVCEFMGIFSDSSHFYIVQELGTEGDLFTWSDNLPLHCSMREEQMRPIVVQLCTAVRHLHDMHIAHRDLSLENILVTREPQDGALTIRVIDFGMAGLSRFATGNNHGKQVNRAPEMLRKDVYDAFLADNFALGCIIYAMGMRRYAWKSTKLGTDVHFDYAWTYGIGNFLNLKPHKEEEQFGSMSSLLIEVLCGLLHLQAKGRASLGEACYRDEGDRPCISHMGWMSAEAMSSCP